LAGLDCNLSEYSNAIFDPQTGAQFAGNIIPAAMISPQAIAVLSGMPAPTGPGIVSNFAANGTGVFNDDAFDVRSDLQATEKMHVFGRYSFANYNQTAGGAIGSFGDSGNENTGDIIRTGALSGIGFGLGINRCNCPLLESENQYQFVNNWTRIVGNHSVKFGADIRYALNLRVPSDRHRAGELSFNQSNTANPAGGVALATFLLGNVTH